MTIALLYAIITLHGLQNFVFILLSQTYLLKANNSRWLKYGVTKPLQASFFTCIIKQITITERKYRYRLSTKKSKARSVIVLYLYN